MLENILQWHKTTPTAKNDLTQNVDSAEVDRSILVKMSHEHRIFNNSCSTNCYR